MNLKFSRAVVFGFAAVLALGATASFAKSRATGMKIFCGDVQTGYATDPWADFSAKFQQDYLTSKDWAGYAQEGYGRVMGGRNCGLNTSTGSPEFEVLFLFRAKSITHETISFGPFTIYNGVIQISGLNVEDFKNDVVLTGESKDALSDASGKITATLDTKPGKGKVKVIIRRKAE